MMVVLPSNIADAGSLPVLNMMFEPAKPSCTGPVGTKIPFVPKKILPFTEVRLMVVWGGVVPGTCGGGDVPTNISMSPPVAPVVPIELPLPMTIEPLVVFVCSRVMLPLLAAIVAPVFTRISELGPGEVMFFRASKLTNPVPPPLPACMGPLTVMLPTGAPVNDCVKTVIFVPAVNEPNVMLPESATKIGPEAVTLVRFNGPGPAKLSVYDEPADEAPTVTAVDV